MKYDMKARANGLLTKHLRAGARGLTTTVINGAILRALRRGRISHGTARTCMHDWPAQMAQRPQWLKWSHYAAAELLEVSRLRRSGRLADARIVLGSVQRARSSKQAALASCTA